MDSLALLKSLEIWATGAEYFPIVWIHRNYRRLPCASSSTGGDSAGLLVALSYLAGEAAQLSLGIPAASTQVFQGLLLFFLGYVATCELSNSFWAGRVMDYGLLSSIIHSILVASTPLVFAGLVR